MSLLRVLEQPGNAKWFRSKAAYWHGRVFGN
jgi:hypothetical protein